MNAGDNTGERIRVCVSVCVLGLFYCLLHSHAVCVCVCLYVLPLLVWGFVLLINKHESRARARPIVCASVCVHSFEGVKISN